MNTIEKTIELLNTSYSPFHVVKNIEEELKAKGFIPLCENRNYNLELGKSYFVKRNDSSIIAFRLPQKITTDFHFQITASHTDSPTFKIKPNPIIRKENVILLNTEPYGGLIYNTWLDKPLSFAGRVMVRQKDRIETRLLSIDEDILIIPNLAIHMNRTINSGYIYNPSKDLLPMFALDIDESFDFKEYLKNKLELNGEDEVLAFDLFLYNRQKATLIGMNREFLASGREDDLTSCYSSLLGFMESQNQVAACNVFVAFDNEEVGSLTKQGANSTFLKETLKRISHILGINVDDYETRIAASTLISIDNAHADHPNHLEIHDQTSPVLMNKGIVIKYNANQSYTSDSLSSSIVKALCHQKGIAFQEYTNRSDMRGGSTLGNISNSMVSLTSVDIGIPQLSMHSSYEVLAKNDITSMADFVKEYYSHDIYMDGSSVRIK